MIGGLKPYPQYRESNVPWLGKIPAGWDVAPGRSLFSEKQVKNKGLVEKRVLSLSYGRIVVKPNEKLHGLVPESFETYQIVEPGDLIIRATDLQNDQTSLRVGLVRDRGIITSAYLCLKGRGPLRAEFGYLVLHAYDLKKILYGLGSGLRQNLSFKDFRYLPVVLPPLEHQDAAIRYIRSADRGINRAIQANKKLIALLNEQKQAIIHQAVTRGLDRTVSLKPSGVPWLGDIPDHWEVRRIKQVSRILRGKFSHRPRNDASLYGGVYPFIQTGAVARAKKLITNYSQTLNEKGLAVSKLFPRGTLVMTIAANIGDVAVLSFDACFPDSVVGFVPLPSTDRDFLFLVLRSMKTELLREAPVNTQGNLNVERIGAMSIPCPPVEEQRRIASAIEDEYLYLDQAVERIEREFALIREYRSRLIAEIVTGRLDVREAAEQLTGPIMEEEDVTEEPAAEDEAEELLEAVADE